MPLPEEVMLSFIKDLLRNSLYILKDEEFQKKVWFRQEGDAVSTYIDATTHFLDRCESIMHFQSCQSYLGQSNYEFLKKMHDKIVDHVDQIERKMDPYLLEEEQLLNDPAWHDIQAMAEELELKLTEFVKKQKHV